MVADRGGVLGCGESSLSNGAAPLIYDRGYDRGGAGCEVDCIGGSGSDCE